MAIEKKRQTEKEAAAGSDKPGSKNAGQQITVHAYSGFKTDERPKSFEVEGRRLTVLRVIKSWKEETAGGHNRKVFFQVHAHDGRKYKLALDEGSHVWTLES